MCISTWLVWVSMRFFASPFLFNVSFSSGIAHALNHFFHVCVSKWCHSFRELSRNIISDDVKKRNRLRAINERSKKYTELVNNVCSNWLLWFHRYFNVPWHKRSDNDLIDLYVFHRAAFFPYSVVVFMAADDAICHLLRTWYEFLRHKKWTNWGQLGLNKKAKMNSRKWWITM